MKHADEDALVDATYTGWEYEDVDFEPDWHFGKTFNGSERRDEAAHV